MSEAALEEVSVLSSIYCGDGEFELLQQSANEGLTVQLNTSVSGQSVIVLFHLPPAYPRCPPDISISSFSFSRTQCQDLRQKLLQQAAALPPEAMLHQLIEILQSLEVSESHRGAEPEVRAPDQDQDEWIAVLSLDHIRSRNRYVSLLERWSKQLQLSGRLLLGRNILVLLQGNRASIKLMEMEVTQDNNEFCCLLKTVKVDVDSSGKKCKERMMKVLSETPSSLSHEHRLQGFTVGECHSMSELSTAFEEVHLTELYQQILPSLRD